MCCCPLRNAGFLVFCENCWNEPEAFDECLERAADWESQRLMRLIDWFVEDILSLTDEEVLVEATEDSNAAQSPL